MDLKKAIWERRSIRAYKNEKIPKEIINNIIEAGIQAPSSCNQQMSYFILIEDEKLKKRLAEEAHFKFILKIPSPIFVITDKRFGDERLANIQGTAAAIQNMMLYAYSIGIGSCWIAGYGDKAIVKNLLKIPRHYHVLGCVAFGYPDKEELIIPIKRDINEITFVNQCNLEKTPTKNPDDWNYKDILSLSERAISAKSPEMGYHHLFKLELEKEVEYISIHLDDKVLSVYEVSGIFLFELAKNNKDKSFITITPSEKIAEWLRARARFLNLNNIEVKVTSLDKIKSNSFNSVICFELFNRLPKKEKENIIKNCKRILNKNGILIGSVLNKNSLYGFLFRKGVSRRYGPEISLSPFEIKNLLKKHNLEIIDIKGFNLIPSPSLFFKTGIPGRYTIFNRYMRYLSKIDLLEDSVHRSFIKNFCTTNIFIAKNLLK